MIFAGYVPNEELPGHYNLCDVFAMPSKGEGFGIVFLEALGCGKPVIAGNKDGSVEPLLGGRLGRLVDPDSVEQIAEAISHQLEEVSGQTSAFSQAEDGRQRSEVGGRQSAKNEEPITNNKQPLDPEVLRSEVIAAFGYERFKERLGEIVEKLKV